MIKELVQRGYPESESETLVLKIAKDLNDKALVPIFMGIVIFIGAIALTIASIKDVGNGMQRITIYFGFMLLGIIVFGKGISNRCKID